MLVCLRVWLRIEARTRVGLNLGRQMGAQDAHAVEPVKEKEDEDVFLAVETSRDLTEKQVMDKISYGEFQIEKNALPDKIIFMTIPRKGRQNKIDRMKIIELIKAGTK